jgi:uncharacterized membrane protein
MALQEARVPHHVNANIETIAELEERLNRRAGTHQRAVETITQKLGRPGTVYALIACVLSWTAYNTIASRVGWPQLDRAPFMWLQCAMALFDGVVALMVLTAQNRQNREAEQRAQLELQVNLLAEQKTTKIIALLEELRRDLPMVRDREDRVADAMQHQVDPKAVIAALESTMEALPESDSKAPPPKRS